MISTQSEIIPLKIGVKYEPPSLALVYAFEARPDKKYCHNIPVMVDSSSEVEVLGKKIYMSENAYLKDIRVEQVIKLIGQIQMHMQHKTTKMQFSATGNPLSLNIEDKENK